MPVINGAAMATSLMASAAAEKGLETAAALCAVIYSVQKFVGAPIASAMGIRYGKKLLKAYRENPAQFKSRRPETVLPQKFPLQINTKNGIPPTS